VTLELKDKVTLMSPKLCCQRDFPVALLIYTVSVEKQQHLALFCLLVYML